MDGWEFKAGLVLGVHSAYFQGKLALLGLRRVTFSSPYWRSLNYPKKVTLNHLVDIQSSFWERAFLSFFWGCEYLLSGPGCLGIMENVIHVWSCLVSQWKYMGVSKNRGTPKWMVYINGKPYWIWMIWGYHYFRKHPYDFPGNSIRDPTWSPSRIGGHQRPFLRSQKGPQQNCQVDVPHFFCCMSNEKSPACLGCIGDEILPNYIGILISQYKDPYKPTSIMESRRVFFVAHMVPGGWTLWTAC